MAIYAVHEGEVYITDGNGRIPPFDAEEAQELETQAKDLYAEIDLHETHYRRDYCYGPMRGSSLDSIAKKTARLMEIHEQIYEKTSDPKHRWKALMCAASTINRTYLSEYDGIEQGKRAIGAADIFAPYIEWFKIPRRWSARFVFRNFDVTTRRCADNLEGRELHELVSLAQAKIVPARLHPRQQRRAQDLRAYLNQKLR